MRNEYFARDIEGKMWRVGDECCIGFLNCSKGWNRKVGGYENSIGVYIGVFYF